MEALNTQKEYLDVSPDMFEFTQRDEENILDVVEGETLSFWKDAWLRLIANKAALIAMIIIGFIVLLSIFVPMLSPHDLDGQDTYRLNLAPRIQYIEKLGI